MGWQCAPAPPAWLVQFTVHTTVPSGLWAQKVENLRGPSGSSPSITASQPGCGYAGSIPALSRPTQ